MKIGIHDADKTNFPNLALMKIAKYHKLKGDNVSLYQDSLSALNFDKVYSSKIFSFTKQEKLFGKQIIKGGTGYNIKVKLSDEIEHLCPDYKLYNLDYSVGFLTRGCPNKCKWCIVPKKEGNIKLHANIDEFLRHDKVILLDNNVLASEHGIKQIEKIIKLGVKIDFNQGLDARLIDNSIAKLLSKVKWLKAVRLACDTQLQIPVIAKAVQLLRWHNVTPSQYFVYCLIKEDIQEALERIKFIKGIYCKPFAQPYRDYQNNTMPTQKQKDLARWVNNRIIFNSCTWEEYKK